MPGNSFLLVDAWETKQAAQGVGIIFFLYLTIVVSAWLLVVTNWRQSCCFNYDHCVVVISKHNCQCYLFSKHVCISFFPAVRDSVNRIWLNRSFEWKYDRESTKSHWRCFLCHGYHQRYAIRWRSFNIHDSSWVFLISLGRQWLPWNYEEGQTIHLRC